MAHNYVIQDAHFITDVQPNDTIQVTATVDGFQVIIMVPASYEAGLPNALAIQNFIVPLLLQAAIVSGKIAAPSPTAVPSITSLGTFSQ